MISQRVLRSFQAWCLTLAPSEIHRVGIRLDAGAVPVLVDGSGPAVATGSTARLWRVARRRSLGGGEQAGEKRARSTAP